MVKRTKIILYLSLILIWSCANQLPPSGGEVDKIPPEVIETYPTNRTINFNDKYFIIKFSEYVDRLSVQNAIFISPALKYELEFSWSGKTLELEFRDTLQQNTTYTVTIGTDVVDINNRNKLAKPYSFTFSTGNKIDTAKISGIVYNNNPSGVMIYAFRNVNEFDPEKIKPNYISQVGIDGKYQLSGLGIGDYKIFALKDKAQDLFYNANEDEYGIQAKEIEIDSTNQVYTNVNFLLTKEDITKPKLTSALMKDRNHFLIQFDKAIDSTKVNSKKFHLWDSTSNKKINAKYFYKYDAKANQFYVAFDDTISFQNYLFVATDIIDLNKNKTTVDKIQFVYKNEKDTLINKPVKVFGEYENEKFDYLRPEINIQFSDGIDFNEVNSRIRIEDNNKNNLSFDLAKVDDALFNILINAKIKQGTDYNLFFNATGLKDFSDKSIDTTYKFKITSNSEMDFSGVFGKVETDENEEVIINLKPVTTKNKYQSKIDEDKNFSFDKVVPGKYLLWTYKDKNKNGKYDYGKIKPFEYSEEFYFYPDTLNLRARWPIGDIEINLKK